MPIITVSVARAFFHSGGLNAGTPSEIASTPVNAAQPELNAFRMMKSDSAPVPAISAASAGGSWTANPSSALRTNPIASKTKMPTRKR